MPPPFPAAPTAKVTFRVGHPNLRKTPCPQQRAPRSHADAVPGKSDLEPAAANQGLMRVKRLLQLLRLKIASLAPNVPKEQVC